MHRAKLLSAIPLLTLAPGCNDEQGDDSFRVLDLDFDQQATIVLTFTQPLAELGEIDPRDFRLSAAVSQAFSYGGMSYSMTNYRDLMLVFGEYGGPTEPYDFISVTAGPGPDQITLEAVESFGSQVCDWLEFAEEYDYGNYDGTKFDAAVFLHYARGEIPIESTSGELLADIGAHWVLTTQTFVMREGYGFTQINPQLRIPCL